MSPRSARRLVLALCLITAAVLSAPGAALAQERTPTPSAKELWDAYPLSRGNPAPARSAAPSPTRTAAVQATDGAQPIVPILGIVAAVAAAAGALFVLRRHRGAPGRALGAAPGGPRLALAGPAATRDEVLFAAARRQGSPSQAPAGPEDEDPAPADPAVGPPDAARSWTAEIRWEHTGEQSRFCVVARDRGGGGDEKVITRSEPVDWPPEDSDAVQRLVAAVDALTEALSLGGWKPLPLGATWYEKRFQWDPSPALSGWAPPLPGWTAKQAGAGATGRFRKNNGSPRGSGRLWRCQITWQAGYLRSRFEVVMHDPVRGGTRVIARSAPFKWMLMGAPDPGSPAIREAVLTLAGALESAGWERVGTAGPWYAARFVWRGEDPPPDPVEPVPAMTRRAP